MGDIQGTRRVSKGDMSTVSGIVGHHGEGCATQRPDMGEDNHDLPEEEQVVGA